MAASSGGYNDEGGPLSDINVVPLVDVVLVLLIVFMITVPTIVGSAAVKVELPETSNASMDKVEDQPVHLYLKRNEAGEVVIYLNDQPVTEANLRGQLAVYANAKEKPPAYVAGDKGIPYGEIMDVVDILGSLGLTKLSLETKHVDKK